MPKTLMLKKGAKVILVRNLGSGLYNGIQGIVHRLAKDSPPVIDFGGKLVPLSTVRFDIFDKTQQKNIASRVQLPIILAFALTVHRAQGQTLQQVEIDCYSFFAPGQMGVAVGRATSTNGLRIVNFNRVAANRQHPAVVYNFYARPSQFSDFQQDLVCCEKSLFVESDTTPETSTPVPSTSAACLIGQPDDVAHDCIAEDVLATEELPTLQSPWDIGEFCEENKSTSFLADVPVELFGSERFRNHVNFLYHEVNEIISHNLTTSQHWIKAYSQLNTFIISDLHMASISSLFQVTTLTKNQNKLSSKLVFWLMDKEVNKKAKDITDKQSEGVGVGSTDADLSSASKGKIRYLAGACVQKITKRLKESVLRKMGQSTKRSKISMKMDYKKQRMLKEFRINESDISETDDSMNEIEFKQQQGRGLTVVSDTVFGFFLYLNAVVQQNLSHEQIHVHYHKLHHSCRLSVDTNEELAQKWVSLFDVQGGDEVEDELFFILIMELFRDITEHFIRIAFVDALKQFKRSVPRKKKQALRTKIQALGERAGPSSTKKPMLEESQTNEYICTTCKLECEWEPAELQNESIACDKCNCWFHYKCAGIKGNESFLKKDAST
ncbi:MAG: hypothetical protein ABW185_13000 [Sedimenticola sp.]